MKINIKLLIVILAIGLTIVLFIFNVFQVDSDKIINKEELSRYSEVINKQFTGTKVPDIVCFDTTEVPFRLSNLMTEKRLLIYHYSEFNCRSCYEMDLSVLQDVFPETTYSVIVLGEYTKFRYFKVYQKRNPCQLPAFRIEHNAFKWDLDHAEVPYFFVLNSDMTASYFYIPSHQSTEITKRYLERVKKLLQD